MVRSLRRSIATCDSEGPIGNLCSSRVPVIGPGEYKAAGQTHHPQFGQVSRQHFGLRLFAMANLVHAELSQYERHVTNNVLQPEQVTAKCLEVVQIDVKGDKIQKRKIQILRRRITRIGHQPGWIDLLNFIAQFSKKKFHATRPVPTNDFWRDFIPDTVRKQVGMLMSDRGCCPNSLSRLL